MPRGLSPDERFARRAMGAIGRNVAIGANLQPLIGETVNGNFVGIGKLPADIALTEAAEAGFFGLSSEEFNEKLSTDLSFGAGEGFVGTQEKTEADLFLAELQDPVNQLVLTEKEKEDPERASRELARRETTEGVLGIDPGVFSQVGGVYEPFFSGEYDQLIASGQFRFESDEPVQFFTSVADLGLTFEQQQRFDAMVAAGDIDPNSLFGVTPPDEQQPGTFLDFLFRGLTGLSGGLTASGLPIGGLPGPSGLTLQQAIDIVVGPGSTALSQINPITGQKWTNEELREADTFARRYLTAQGLPALSIQNVNNTNLSTRVLSPEDADALGGKIPGAVGIYNPLRRLSLEELTLVAELYAGHSRILNNPRDLGGSGEPSADEFAQTLLSGNFIL